MISETIRLEYIRKGRYDWTYCVDAFDLQELLNGRIKGGYKSQETIFTLSKT